MIQHDFTGKPTKYLIELGYGLKQSLEFTPLLKEPKQNTINQIKAELKRRVTIYVLDHES